MSRRMNKEGTYRVKTVGRIGGRVELTAASGERKRFSRYVGGGAWESNPPRNTNLTLQQFFGLVCVVGGGMLGFEYAATRW